MVLVEMEREPRFADHMRKLLDKAVTRPQDRDVIADLLQAATAITRPAVNGNATTGPTETDGTSVTAAFATVLRETATG